MGQPGSGYPPPQLLHPLPLHQPPHINAFPAPPSTLTMPLASYPGPTNPLQQRPQLLAGYPGQLPLGPAALAFPPAPYQTNTVPGMKTIQVPVLEQIPC